MFSLFKRKKASAPPTDDKSKWAQEAASRMLMVQLTLSGWPEDETTKRLVFSPYGCGYMFGFADAFQQVVGASEGQALAGMVIVYLNLFGEDVGPKLLRKCLDAQADPVFARGRVAGGEDLFAWRRAPETTAPMGLARYVDAARREPPASP
jgi:hypothetical protein